MRKNKIFLNPLAFTLVLLLASCGKNSSSSDSGVVFRKALGADIAFTDPHMADDRDSLIMVMNTFEGLFRINKCTGKAEPALTQDYEFSSDGLTYVFRIHQNMTFSDGVPINAQTFLDSFRRALDPNTHSSNAYMLAHVIKNGEQVLKGELPATELGVRVLDNFTLEVKLSISAPYFLDILARPVAVPLPMHLVRERPGDWNRLFPLVSNGAFTMSEWHPSSRIVLEKNPRYWDAGNVEVSRVIIYTNDDLNTGYFQYLNEEVDLLWKIPPDKVKEAKIRRDWHSDFFYNGEYYLFNVERKPFNDVRVRRAINMAISRDTLTETILGGGQVPLYAMIPAQPGYRALDFFQEDVEEARRLLSEAGFPNGEGFPEFSILYNTNEDQRKVAEFIQEQLKQNLGINAKLQNMEWKTYLSTIDTFDYDIARCRWSPDYPDPLAWLEFFHSKAIYSNYHNKVFDALLDETNFIPETTMRMVALQQVEEKLMVDLPFMPLYTNQQISLIDFGKWEGYYTNPTGIPFYRCLKKVKPTPD